MNWEEHRFSVCCKEIKISSFFPKNGKYDVNKKDVLFISHIIDHTGAPLVLFDLMKEYQKKYNVFLITMKEGNLKDELLENNIPIFVGMPVQLKLAFDSFKKNEFEQVWINTLICHGFAMLFQNTDINVYWWFHEPDFLFRMYYERMPELPLYSHNVKFVAVSKLVQETIFKYYGVQSSILHMPIKDLWKVNKNLNEIMKNNKVIFFMPARFQRTKGHDIITKAILNMTDEYRNRAEFWFAGSIDEKEFEYYELICSLSRLYPDTVKVLGELSREEVYEIYLNCDCVIAPSREDATPTTIVEGMMNQRICICSDSTGISRYLTDGENAFIVKNEDEKDLQRCVEYVIDSKDDLDLLKRAGREIYLENFEESMVWNQLKKLTDTEVI